MAVWTDNFNDNVIDATKWDLLQVVTGTVAEANQELECTMPVAGDLAGLCTKITYDSSVAQADILQHNQAARYTFLMCSLTKNLVADPALDNDWYRFYLGRDTLHIWVDRKVGGAYLNLHSQPWAAQLETLTITIVGGLITFLEAGAPIYAEAYALGPTDLYWYIHGQAAGPETGMNWFDDWSLDYYTPPPAIEAMAPALAVGPSFHF